MIRRPRKSYYVVLFLLLASTPLKRWLEPKAGSATTPVEKLQEFTLDQVSVSDAYYQDLFNLDVTYMMTTLDVDRLLAPFKAVANGQDPGTATGLNLYGGWEAASSLLRGHTMGHYMSALSRAYLNAKGSNPTLAGQIKTKLDYVITQLASFQAKSSTGYLFGSPPTQFDVVEGKVTGNSWVPWYTMHKIIAGLIDVYKFEGNATALTVAGKLGDWTYARASGWSAATRTTVLGVEYGGMNDCLYELYKYTNSANHLTAAHIFDETTLFTPIAAGNDTLNGLHANATIPKFIGALNRYVTLGTSESSYYTAANEFWTLVLKDHTYVTGGHGEDEHFHTPGQLDAIRDNLNNESCNAYNMSKLARELYKITGDVKYADYYERTQINEVLSAMNPSTGRTTYFKPMGTGYFKAYGTVDSTFWCCNGTGLENYAKLGDSLYFHDATDLYVIGYVSSTLSWSDRGLSLTQTTDVPVSNTSTITINTAPQSAVNIKFRIPWWIAACQSMTVAVNGQPVTVTPDSGYLSVSRVWQAGDTIALTMPAEVQVSRLPDNQNVVAFTYGPVVLSAGLGTSQMTTTAHALTIAATKPSGIQDTITINSGTTINGWLASIKTNLVRTSTTALTFSLKNTDSNSTLTFTPQYQRYLDRYGVYFTLAGTTGAAVTPPACPPPGTGGAGGGGGSAATGTGGIGGAAGKGGTTGTGGGAGNSGTGGSTGVGGTTGTGGTGGSNIGTGTGGAGSSGSGGTTSSGSGGATVTGSGGNGAGGSTGSGGTGSGGANGQGGGSATGGSSGTTGGTSGTGETQSTGCSCSVGDTTPSAGLMGSLLLVLGTFVRRRARRR
ncbi:MAG TPA: beta-L-arabinofuranosidase domain-containing protein [Polyangia bacterium]|nr:beta-L-arabinofuranosidase domain-containing protein [Polyangia bacterium]